MKYKEMSFIQKLLHSHIWQAPKNDRPTTCEECGYQPTCPKHGCKMYTHGRDFFVDCLKCQKGPWDENDDVLFVFVIILIVIALFWMF